MLKKIMAGTAAAMVLLAAPGAFAEKLIKYTHFQPGRLDQPKHAAAMAFKAHVEGQTGGEVTVEIYPAGQLGNATSVMEGLRLGSIELGVVHDGGISSIYPGIDLFAMPYLFPSQAVAWKVLDGPFGQEFSQAMLDETGVRVLGFADNGIRHFTNSKKPVTSPADLEGLKIRVQPSPVFIKLVESLGASATAIDWAELPAALAQGTADGQENGVTNILAASLYQSQKFVSLDGHVYSLHAYLMSDAFWQQLDPEEQQVVAEAAEIAKWIHRGMTTAQDMNASTILGEQGMEVTTLTPAQIAVFREKAQPAVRAWLEERVGKEWVEKLLAATAEAGQGG
ncbi:DctP family TRAP transporter solute-binding subunit [Marinimicrococcus flavescens]|uniref:DctP family TRAP transporter solute-binding subunit n=1 Tax=Marinimicrococcus flavescens TaxID=3031815 RepID=A0AAP4D5K7_9PROT|nr:DctP family TRAP transporter solute-binding subunit [Marinimicrococcus flavescens]